MAEYKKLHINKTHLSILYKIGEKTMRKITVINANNAYIGNDPTDYVLEHYNCCGLPGYNADIYYDINAKKPSEYMIKLATKKILRERIKELKSKSRLFTLRDYLSCCGDKEKGRKEYFSNKESYNKSIRKCEDLLAKLA